MAWAWKERVRNEAVIAATATITPSEDARQIVQKFWHICRKSKHAPNAGDADTPMDDAEPKRNVSIKAIQVLIQRVHRGIILPVVKVMQRISHRDIQMDPKVALI